MLQFSLKKKKEKCYSISLFTCIIFFFLQFIVQKIPYLLGLNMFLVLTFCAPLKNSPYISLNVFKILTFYLRYQN